MRLMICIVLLLISGIAACAQDIDSVYDKNNQDVILRYGWECGYLGPIPRPRKEIEDYIIAKDIKGINSWLRSSNNVKKPYAVEALIRLRKEGIELTSEQIDLIKRIKRKRKRIPVCRGCITGKNSINKALKQYEL